MKPKYRILELNGPPGAGKGTILRHVVEPYCQRNGIALVKLPVSDELRLYKDEHPEEAPQIAADMLAGRLVADNIVNAVFTNALRRVEKPKGSALFVIDGAPRTSGQIQTSIIKPMEILGVTPENFLFTHLITPVHICGFRAALRRREDDNEDTFVVRWDEWEGKTVPAIKTVVQNASRFGITVQEINGQFIIGSESLVEALLFGNGRH